jgi:hypothetical protein
MGTLHEVHQLKPTVISEAAIVRVKKEKQSAFLKKYKTAKSENNLEWGLFSNTMAIISADGKVERYSMYSANRIIDLKVPGVYISIQSGSKYGFNSDFDEFIGELAPYLENALFFVIWDFVIRRYEIENGALTFQLRKDFEKWDYDFEKYLDSNYPDSPQVRADFYVDRITEMQLFIDELIKDDDDPGIMQEVEDYEDLLQKLDAHKNHIPNKQVKAINDWLNDRLIFQRAWEDENYD